MFPEYKMGIDPIKPAGEFPPPTFGEMRVAIDRGRRDSAVIAQALRQAEHMGLSGEDKYVLLAYYALTHLEDTHKRLMKMVSLTPSSTTFIMPDGVPRTPTDTLRRGDER
jgi:hypothetical protein